MPPEHIASEAAGAGRLPSANSLSRRKFLRTGAAAGGGLMLSLSLPFASRDADAADAGTFVPNAFIRIGGDGQIVLTMPYVEMGQGTYTSISMLIAEELEVDLKQVRFEHAPPNEKLYGNPLLGGIQATGNSNAIRAAWQPLRQAGAVARTMLVTAAAKRCRSRLLPRSKRGSASPANAQKHPIRGPCGRCRADPCSGKRGAEAVR
jgi:isoquinoline 1-oxidoreductase beta subunit